MIPVAGKTNKRLPKRDQFGVYRAACHEFADELGWKRDEIWELFDEISCIREVEMRIPRALAEHFALDDVKAMCDKRGQGEPC